MYKVRKLIFTCDFLIKFRYEIDLSGSDIIDFYLTCY